MAQLFAARRSARAPTPSVQPWRRIRRRVPGVMPGRLAPNLSHGGDALTEWVNQHDGIIIRKAAQRRSALTSGQRTFEAEMGGGLPRFPDKGCSYSTLLLDGRFGGVLDVPDEQYPAFLAAVARTPHSCVSEQRSRGTFNFAVDMDLIFREKEPPSQARVDAVVNEAIRAIANFYEPRDMDSEVPSLLVIVAHSEEDKQGAGLLLRKAASEGGDGGGAGGGGDAVASGARHKTVTVESRGEGGAVLTVAAWKVGVHLHCPQIAVTTQQAHRIAMWIQERVGNKFPALVREEIADLAVYRNNGLRMLYQCRMVECPQCTRLRDGMELDTGVAEEARARAVAERDIRLSVEIETLRRRVARPRRMALKYIPLPCDAALLIAARNEGEKEHHAEAKCADDERALRHIMEIDGENPDSLSEGLPPRVGGEPIGFDAQSDRARDMHSLRLFTTALRNWALRELSGENRKAAARCAELEARYESAKAVLAEAEGAAVRGDETDPALTIAHAATTFGGDVADERATRRSVCGLPGCKNGRVYGKNVYRPARVLQCNMTTGVLERDRRFEAAICGDDVASRTAALNATSMRILPATDPRPKLADADGVVVAPRAPFNVPEGCPSEPRDTPPSYPLPGAAGAGTDGEGSLRVRWTAVVGRRRFLRDSTPIEDPPQLQILQRLIRNMTVLPGRSPIDFLKSNYSNSDSVTMRRMYKHCSVADARRGTDGTIYVLPSGTGSNYCDNAGYDEATRHGDKCGFTIMIVVRPTGLHVRCSCSSKKIRRLGVSCAARNGRNSPLDKVNVLKPEDVCALFPEEARADEEDAAAPAITVEDAAGLTNRLKRRSRDSASTGDRCSSRISFASFENSTSGDDRAATPTEVAEIDEAMAARVSAAIKFVFGTNLFDRLAAKNNREFCSEENLKRIESEIVRKKKVPSAALVKHCTGLIAEARGDVSRSAKRTSSAAPPPEIVGEPVAGAVEPVAGAVEPAAGAVEEPAATPEPRRTRRRAARREEGSKKPRVAFEDS